MSELEQIAQSEAALQRLERPAGLISATLLSAAYVMWRLRSDHVVAIYTWIIPFAIGYAISTFVISTRLSQLALRRRELVLPGSDAELPAARLVSRTIEAPPVTPVASQAPEQTQPADPTTGPRFLG